MIWIFLWGIIIFAFVCIVPSMIVGWNLTHPSRKPLDETPENYGMIYEKVEFHSSEDNIMLQGWFIPSIKEQSDATIIFSHGYAGNRLESGVPALALAKSLTAAGYHVLMFDFRNSGLSQGKLTSVGFFEKRDLSGAIRFARAKGTKKIVLLGFSMGAVTSLMAAAEDNDVAGVIADSPFHHLTRYLNLNLSYWSRLPNFPFTPLILLFLTAITGIKTDQVNGLYAVDQIYPRPILFIHSKNDAAIPYLNSEIMWQKHKERFEFWLTSGEGHVSSYSYDPELYTAKVIRFLEKI